MGRRDAVAGPHSCNRTVTMSLEDVFAGRYEHWSGLPAWSVDEAAGQAHPILARRKAEERRRALHRFQVVYIERPMPPHRVELWSRWASTTVSIIECDRVLAESAERTLAVLGQPELLLEDRVLRLSYLAEDFVYVSRGLTLSVGRRVDNGQDRDRQILHVRLFPIITEAQYLTEVDDPGISGTPRPAG